MSGLFDALAKRSAAESARSRRSFLRTLAVAGTGAVAGVVLPASRAGAVTCRPHQTLCGTKCVNLTKDRKNCGACAHKCSRNQVCTGGTCVDCPVGTVRCKKTCVDTSTDLNNCGACGNICQAANGIAGCASGACYVASCNTGYADCNGVYADGCEAFLATDVNNCGTCGHACGPIPHGVPGCFAGDCHILVCDPGFADCDGIMANGCETDIQNDAHNCGACGFTCPAGLSCSNGNCS